ncbi:MAG: UDP-N-acetylglucosamine 1-carboxyvinyltransferase [Clostridia bacterium]|nr:UDP-N-acetylglucosamine 1-carboxyvinyltransferase [Clostridia bacterium]
MEKLLITGKQRLYGEIIISGMKNSALPIIFACLLVPDDCIIKNIPHVSDVENSLEILRSMGVKAEFVDKNTVLINAKYAKNEIAKMELVSKMRASSYLMGTMLSRFGKVDISMPGGCNFGARPLDLHFKGFEKMGAIFTEKSDKIQIKVNKSLKCSKITLDKISVGATINMVLASALTQGETIIENVALEPHVDDLICFLQHCGAEIVRKNNSIVVRGVKRLHGTEYTIMPDTIEALTYLTYLGITGGYLNLKGICPSHLECATDIFLKIGMSINFAQRSILAKVDKQLTGTDVTTSPYPGFPTDLHPQFASLLSFCKGGGSITEMVFPTRFKYVYELQKAGVQIYNRDNIAIINESKPHSAVLDATDLRAGAGLVGVALGAEGESTINNVNYIVRGYENLVEKLSSVGGKIKIIKGEN